LVPLALDSAEDEPSLEERVGFVRNIPAMVSLRELSRLTGIGLKTITDLRDEGRIPVYQITKKRQLVIYEEFMDWFHEQKIEQKRQMTTLREVRGSRS
jgi:hypothetical protein